MPLYTASASGAIIDPYTGNVVSSITNSVDARVRASSLVNGDILITSVTDSTGGDANISNITLSVTGTLGYQASATIDNFGIYSYRDFFSNTAIYYSVNPATLVLTPISNTSGLITTASTISNVDLSSHFQVYCDTTVGSPQWADTSTLANSVLNGTAHTNTFANSINTATSDSVSTMTLAGNLAISTTPPTNTIYNHLSSPEQALSLTVTAINSNIGTLFSNTVMIQSSFDVITQLGDIINGNITIATSTGETINGNITLAVQSSNVAVGVISNTMPTTVGTTTPLMLAAGYGLMQNTGLNLNQNFNSNVLTYTNPVYGATSAFASGLQGELVTNGNILYDLHVEEQTITTPSMSGGPPTTTIVYVAVKDPVGSLESVFPGGWGIDGRVYNGTLSDFGGMVADRVSSGFQTIFHANLDASTGVITHTDTAPIYTGRYGKYYSGATTSSLGANTIPAITQVVPRSVSGITGSLKYWLDQAVNRTLGSTTGINVKSFISIFGQAYGWVSRGNRYLNMTRTTERTTFATYNVNNYSDFITGDWKTYATGNALPRAFTNIGTMTDTIYTGNFGTVGAVTYTLLGRGLGRVGNLTAQLAAQRVNTNDVMNPIYTDKLTRILSNITLPEDLETIQGTIESTIPDMTSPMDYTDIGKAAGQRNDSAFANFAETGADLYNKSPYMTITSGADIAAIIGNIVTFSDSRVESVAGPNSLLNSTITTQLRSILPVNEYDTTVTLFDVIGAPSGYLNEALRLVNEGLAELDATDYGPWIRTVLTNIVGSTNDTDDVGNPIGSINTSAIENYEYVMNQILADETGRIQEIVRKINTNYEFICKHIAIENINWNRAKFSTTIFDNDDALLSFATSLHQYAVDSQGIGSYPYLVGMTDDTQNGAVIASVLIEGRNSNLLQGYNIPTNIYVG